MGKASSKLAPMAVDELQKLTEFNRMEIKQWYSGFIKDCPSGQLDMDGFKRLYETEFPFGDPGPLSEYLFNAFDQNHNGQIDFKEFLTALSVTSRGDIHAKLEWAFEMIDVNGDGQISKEEMVKFVDGIYRLMGSSMPGSDESPEACVNTMFAAMDKNNDGVLSFEEFREGTRKDQSLLKALQMYNPGSAAEGELNAHGEAGAPAASE